jgi:hypothetical protein
MKLNLSGCSIIYIVLRTSQLILLNSVLESTYIRCFEGIFFRLHCSDFTRSSGLHRISQKRLIMQKSVLYTEYVWNISHMLNGQKKYKSSSVIEMFGFCLAGRSEISDRKHWSLCNGKRWHMIWNSSSQSVKLPLAFN